MTLPADFPRPTKHPFTPGTNGECLTCGFEENFGLLHTEPPVVEAVPDVSAWRHDDILLAPGGIYRVKVSRYDETRFVPLEAIADGQARPPHGAKLIVRGGEVVR